MAVVAAALTGVAACGTNSGSSGGDPKSAVLDALTAYQNGKELTVTLKLDTSAADLKAFAALGDDPATLTDAQATAFTGGSIQIAIKSDKSFKATAKDANASKEGSLALVVNAGGSPKLIEVRVVDGTLYARANVQQIVSYAGDSFSDIQQFADAQSGTLPFLKPAVAGDWVKLQLNDLEQFAKSASGGSTAPSLAPSQVAGLQQALIDVLKKDISATKSTDGGSLGDHYVLTGSSRTVATDLVGVFKTQIASIPGASKLLANADPTSVPDKTVTVDAYVKNGKVSAIKLNLGQFLDPADAAKFTGKTFNLEMDFADQADVSVPSGATEINLAALIGGLGHLGSS
jgi:hypothetical protein